MVMSTALFYDASVNLTPYMALLPNDCADRIDIVNRSHIRWDGYAWFAGKRLIIYDGGLSNDEDRKYVMAHELGHLCAEKDNLNHYSYSQNEITADIYASNILKNTSEVQQNGK